MRTVGMTGTRDNLDATRINSEGKAQALAGTQGRPCTWCGSRPRALWLLSVPVFPTVRSRSGHLALSWGLTSPSAVEDFCTEAGGGKGQGSGVRWYTEPNLASSSRVLMWGQDNLGMRQGSEMVWAVSCGWVWPRSWRFWLSPGRGLWWPRAVLLCPVCPFMESWQLMGIGHHSFQNCKEAV